MSATAEKQKNRFLFLKMVYDRTQGIKTKFVNMWDLGEELGWDRQTTETTAQYLVGEGLIKFWAFGGTLGITHLGVKEVERAMDSPDEPTTHFPAVVNIMSGDFRGSILNIASTLDNIGQTVSVLPDANAAVKEELKQLVEQLNEVLQSVPLDKVEEAEAVAWATESLLKTTTEEKPNRVKIEITKEGLKKAAENIASVLPTVLPIAEKIISTIGRLGSLMISDRA